MRDVVRAGDGRRGVLAVFRPHRAGFPENDRKFLRYLMINNIRRIRQKVLLFVDFAYLLARLRKIEL